jgi:hypothetical protein
LVLLAVAFGIVAACSSGPSGGAPDTAALTRPDQWSDISVQFSEREARFDFRYQNPTETLYKVHASTLADMSWGVYFNFGSAAGSPIIVQNPNGVWSAYACGETLYWRLEAVYTGGILSSIQGPTTVQC